MAAAQLLMHEFTPKLWGESRPVSNSKKTINQIRDEGSARVEHLGMTVFPNPGEYARFQFAIERERFPEGDEIMPMICGLVQYRSPVGDDKKETEFAYVVVFKSKLGGPLIEWPLGELSGDRIQVEKLPLRPRVT